MKKTTEFSIGMAITLYGVICAIAGILLERFTK
jgi:predicted MFS family arabinose efflux permease